MNTKTRAASVSDDMKPALSQQPICIVAAVNLTAGDGRVLTSFITAETNTTLTVRLGPGVVQELKKSDIKKRETIRQSSMPDGLSGTMAPQEFLDLVEFLASQKATPIKK